MKKGDGKETKEEKAEEGRKNGKKWSKKTERRKEKKWGRKIKEEKDLPTCFTTNAKKQCRFYLSFVMFMPKTNTKPP